MPAYAVNQGECVESIAAANGFVWQTIWNHPENEALKGQRKSPNHLFPGDSLFIPERALRQDNAPTEQRHRYQLKGRLTKLLIRLLNFGDPVAGMKWKATISGAVQEGSTDADGNLEIAVHPSAASASLVLDNGTAYDLQLRHLDPIETLSGCQARLNNLGYHAGPVDNLDGPLTQAAATAFQTDFPPLDVDGIIGPHTRAKLEEIYAS